jgi:hypothetical protein
MAHDLGETVGTVIKRVAMDRSRLLSREQARRHQGTSNDFDLLACCLIRCANLFRLRHELLGGRVACEAEAPHKFQGNGGALVWA